VNYFQPLIITLGDTENHELRLNQTVEAFLIVPFQWTISMDNYPEKGIFTNIYTQVGLLVQHFLHCQETAGEKKRDTVTKIVLSESLRQRGGQHAHAPGRPFCH